MLDSDDLERLYRTHSQALYAFSLSMTRNETDTFDLLQDVFQKLAARPNLLDGVHDHRAFLIRMLHNMIKDLVRRKTTRQKNDDVYFVEHMPLFEKSEQMDEESYRMALSRALRLLPEEQRQIVHLKLWEGLTFEKIAEILEISQNTAASRYRYGLDKLRELLRPLYDEIKDEPKPLKPL